LRFNFSVPCNRLIPPSSGYVIPFLPPRDVPIPQSTQLLAYARMPLTRFSFIGMTEALRSFLSPPALRNLSLDHEPVLFAFAAKKTDERSSRTEIARRMFFHSYLQPPGRSGRDSEDSSLVEVLFLKTFFPAQGRGSRKTRVFSPTLWFSPSETSISSLLRPFPFFPSKELSSSSILSL